MATRTHRRDKNKPKKPKALQPIYLLAIEASLPDHDSRLGIIRYVAGHASRRMYAAMLDQEIEQAQATDDDRPSSAMFRRADLNWLRQQRDKVESDLDFHPAIRVLDEVLTRSIEAMRDPASHYRDDVAAAVTSISTPASSELCQLIATHGSIPRKVVAINILGRIYPYVPATAQAEIASALEVAVQHAAGSKRVAAAIAAAQAAIRSSADTTVSQASAAADSPNQEPASIS